MQKDFGYNLCVKSFKPLWKNETFRRSIESHIIEGDIQSVSDEFDFFLKIGAFEDLVNTLDILNRLDECGNSNQYKKIFFKSHLWMIIKKYENQTRKVLRK